MRLSQFSVGSRSRTSVSRGLGTLKLQQKEKITIRLMSSIYGPLLRLSDMIQYIVHVHKLQFQCMPGHALKQVYAHT